MFQGLEHIASYKSAVQCAELHSGVSAGGVKKRSHNSCITSLCLLICLIYMGRYFVLSEQYMLVHDQAN